MNFSGFMVGFLMLRAFFGKYVGHVYIFAFDCVAATGDMIKRNVSSWWRVKRLVQATPPTTLLDNLSGQNASSTQAARSH